MEEKKRRLNKLGEWMEKHHEPLFTWDKIYHEMRFYLDTNILAFMVGQDRQ